jgi:RNA polymerase sigma factor (sigma-70 family)
VLFLNREFIEKIYRESEYYDIVKNTIIRIIKGINAYDLDDCISDVYETALRKKNLEEHPNIHGWLSITAKNVAMRYLKKKSFTRITIPIDDNQLGEKYNFSNDEHLNELLNVLKETLKTSEYKLFYLKFVERRSNEELAGLLRIKPDSIIRKVHRLKEKIKKILEET